MPEMCRRFRRRAGPHEPLCMEPDRSRHPDQPYGAVCAHLREPCRRSHQSCGEMSRATTAARVPLGGCRSIRAAAEWLNERGVESPGGAKWHAPELLRVTCERFRRPAPRARGAAHHQPELRLSISGQRWRTRSSLWSVVGSTAGFYVFHGTPAYRRATETGVASNPKRVIGRNISGVPTMRPACDRRFLSPREILERRGFPEARFAGLWAGNGTERRCESCGQIIEPDEVEYELDFSEHGAAITLRMHLECWEDWRLER